MRSWTSLPRKYRSRRWLGCAILIAAGSIAWMAWPGPGALAADWNPVLRVDVGGGAESDLILDPSLDTHVVSGGAFAEITPRLSLDGRLTSTTRLRLHARGSLERFFDEDQRWLSSQSVGLDLTGPGPGLLRWRWSAGQNFFDDSQRDTVRRLGGWTELGAGPVLERAAFEVAATLGGRRYPQLVTPDDLGVLGTYDDWSRTVRATGLFDLGAGLWLRLGSERCETFARDPAFDSRAWLHSAGLGTSSTWGLDLRASAMVQRRTFERRIPVEDDEYLVTNLAAIYRLNDDLAVLAQGGFYRYTWPDGSAQNSYRFGAGVRLSWGATSPLDRLALPEHPPTQTRSDGSVSFRIHAPGATEVFVVGGFNGWDATRHALHRAGDGWWESAVSLAPGEYQYGYVVDGVFTTPPEATITVDDGFGGRNGWIEILP